MNLPVDMRCLRCGRPDEGTSLECLCGASLLIDVVLTGGALGERKGFQVARALAALGPPPPGTGARAPEPGLTTQEISQRALPRTVSLRCEGSTGAGFFVDAEQVLTNAHVACPGGATMEVTLADGRRMEGRTVERDEALDLATVRVPGARAEPLALGDAADLSPGDRLVFIGSPKGLAFTVAR